MNNQEIDEKCREQKYMQKQAEDFYKAARGSCMIFILLVIFITIAIICLFSSCSRSERQSPVKVVYKQRIESNSQYNVYKVTSYELKETHYDTVRK